MKHLHKRFELVHFGRMSLFRNSLQVAGKEGQPLYATVIGVSTFQLWVSSPGLWERRAKKNSCKRLSSFLHHAWVMLVPARSADHSSQVAATGSCRYHTCCGDFPLVSTCKTHVLRSISSSLISTASKIFQRRIHAQLHGTDGKHTKVLAHVSSFCRVIA